MSSAPALNQIWLRRLQGTIFNINLKPPQASFYGLTKASTVQGTIFNINLKPIIMSWVPCLWCCAWLHVYVWAIQSQVRVGLRLILKVVPCAELAVVEPCKLSCGGLRLMLKMVPCSLLGQIGFMIKARVVLNYQGDVHYAWIYMWTSCFLGQASGMLQLYKRLTSSRSYSRFAFSIIVTPLYTHRKKWHAQLNCCLRRSRGIYTICAHAYTQDTLIFLYAYAM